jgi:hypothetical protein
VILNLLSLEKRDVIYFCKSNFGFGIANLLDSNVKYDIGRRVWVVVLAIRKASAIDVLIRVIRK